MTRPATTRSVPTPRSRGRPRNAGRTSHREIHQGTRPATMPGAARKKSAEPKTAFALFIPANSSPYQGNRGDQAVATFPYRAAAAVRGRADPRFGSPAADRDAATLPATARLAASQRASPWLWAPSSAAPVASCSRLAKVASLPSASSAALSAIASSSGSSQVRSALAKSWRTWMRHHLLDAGMADADAQAPVVVADRRR